MWRRQKIILKLLRRLRLASPLMWGWWDDHGSFSNKQPLTRRIELTNAAFLKGKWEVI